MIGHRTLGELQLADQHRAAFAQTRDDGRIVVGTEVAVERHPGRRRNPSRIGQVLHCEESPLQRPAQLAAHDLAFGLPAPRLASSAVTVA